MRNSTKILIGSIVTGSILFSSITAFAQQDVKVVNDNTKIEQFADGNPVGITRTLAPGQSVHLQQDRMYDANFKFHAKNSPNKLRVMLTMDGNLVYLDKTYENVTEPVNFEVTDMYYNFPYGIKVVNQGSTPVTVELEIFPK